MTDNDIVGNISEYRSNPDLLNHITPDQHDRVVKKLRDTGDEDTALKFEQSRTEHLKQALVDGVLGKELDKMNAKQVAKIDRSILEDKRILPHLDHRVLGQLMRSDLSSEVRKTIQRNVNEEHARITTQSTTGMSEDSYNNIVKLKGWFDRSEQGGRPQF